MARLLNVAYAWLSLKRMMRLRLYHAIQVTTSMSSALHNMSKLILSVHCAAQKSHLNSLISKEIV